MHVKRGGWVALLVMVFLVNCLKIHADISGSTANYGGLGPNLAAASSGAKIEAVSSEYSISYNKEKAIDGNRNYEHNWTSKGEGNKAWIKISLASPAKLTVIGYKSIGFDPGGKPWISDRVHKFKITFSDGSSQLCIVNPNTLDDFQYYDIEDVTTSFIKWEVIESGGGNTGAYEIEAYSSIINPQKTEKMLEIGYRRGPDLPQGFQDSAGGFLGNRLITACGFCGGKDKGTRPERYPRGFLKKVWALDLAKKDSGWISLPDFPGVERQGLFCAVVNNSIYYWGGFSYTEPCCYDDGYRLSYQNEEWVWEPLPSLPWRLTFSGTCAIGTKIYVFGGHDYDNKEEGGNHTLTDRTGKIKRMGARFLMLDTDNLEAGWQHLAECPGTPRGAPAMAAVAGKIYVLAGTSRPSDINIACSVVDNWMYDPDTNKWSPLPDMPVSSGGFPSGNIVFKNRYILLIGGYPYDKILNPDGTLRDKYGTASTSIENPSSYYNNVFVYDTQTNRFGTADSLPLNNFFPMAVVRGDEIFLIGGETGGGKIDGVYYAHHPDLLLIGKINELKW
ncbi:MAG: discoidin domain-containing protein [Candidatus Omnitrophota bacterium]